MLNKIKSTLHHTTVYGMGNVFTKLIGFILLPLYTRYISVGEYGILGILEVTILIGTQILIIGQTQSFLRFYERHDLQEKRDALFFSLLLFLLLIIGIFNLIAYPLVPVLARKFQHPDLFSLYFRLVVLIVSVRIINTYILGVLRAREKSLFYSLANIIKFLMVMAANIYFIAVLRQGISGIMYAYLLGELVMFIIIIPVQFMIFIPRIDFSLLRESLFFGFPFIFTSLSGMFLNMGDRYILKILASYEEVGFYSLGYKIAGIINIFLIQSFSLSFLPQAYRIFGSRGDKRYFTKMMTYFLFVLFWAGLGLSIFSSEVIRIFALNSDYWAAYSVIPVIVLAYVVSGAKHVASIPLYIKQRSALMALNTIIAAASNIILNFLLIPFYGRMGAAYATLLAFLILLALTAVQARKIYAVSYENSKILKMLILALILYFISHLLGGMGLIFRIALKSVLVLSFPFLLYCWRFYEPIELERLRGLAKKMLKI